MGRHADAHRDHRTLGVAKRPDEGGSTTRAGEIESSAKFVLIGVTLVALFLVIGSGDWGGNEGYLATERSNAAYADFARDLFENHGFELAISALIIAAAALGGLQIAREEEYD